MLSLIRYSEETLNLIYMAADKVLRNIQMNLKLLRIAAEKSIAKSNCLGVQNSISFGFIVFALLNGATRKLEMFPFLGQQRVWI